MRLLALDTATELCSVALWLDGQIIDRQISAEGGHGSTILPSIAELLAQVDLSLAALDAIAFGRGPGAFTGVRLAASVAQGLAFTIHRPLLPISDLRALAAQALALPQAPERVLVCQDARMQELYWGCFERRGTRVVLLGDEQLSAPAQVHLPVDGYSGAVAGAGSGWSAYEHMGAAGAVVVSPIWPQLRPRAREIAALAAADGLGAAVPPEQALPVYLRDNVATVSSRK